jgi:hypothetical protein
MAIVLKLCHFFSLMASMSEVRLDNLANLCEYGAVTEPSSPYHASPHPAADRVLTPAAVQFVADLHQRFDARRRDLLAGRALGLDRTQSELLDAGQDPTLVSQARTIFEQVGLDDEFLPFLTLPAYDLLA